MIDEWDAPLRERGDRSSQERWVYFLRVLFKNSTFTPKAVAACHMTGILPIVRYDTQFALSDFHECTFLTPDAYAPFVGFTEAKVEDMAESPHGHGRVQEVVRRLRACLGGQGDARAQGREVLRPLLRDACDNCRVGPYRADSEAFSSLCF